MKRKTSTTGASRRSSNVRPRAANAASPLTAHKTLALLSIATIGLMSLIFAPLSVWPLAFVCLVPWLLFVGGSAHAPRVYFWSFVLGLGFFFLNMRWLYHSTGLGYAMLSVYQAAYFPLIALPVRHVVRRRRWPLALALPLVWTGSEMLRAVLLSGFPWFFLSHSLYCVPSLIQISDLVGAYGVTFMVAAVNGAVADVLFSRLSINTGETAHRSSRGMRVGLALTPALVVASFVYGQVRLHRPLQPGPKVAVIQGDYLNTVYFSEATGHDRATETEKMATYLAMAQAAAADKPDLFLFPESPWTMFLNPEARDFFSIARRSYKTLQALAHRHNAVVVTGSTSLVPTPFDLGATEHRYNSANVFLPDGSEPQRYDKIHLVYFGEIVPFRFGRLRFLYLWLNRLAPWSGPDGSREYSLFPGTAFRRFDLTARAAPGRTFHFSIPICYEDVMPYMSRRFVYDGSNRKLADIFMNISNDGWFGRGVQQPQHFAICVFRAVENRVAIARAVNTGISGFIKPTGEAYNLVTGDPDSPWPGQCGYAVADLEVDPTLTFYSRYGDWFAWGCALLWLGLFVDYWIIRARGRIDRDSAKER